MTVLPVSTTDPQVLEFLNLWGLKDPVYLDYQDVGEGYAPDFCHVSAKHVAAKHGGRRIHGWALWQVGQGSATLIIADFHSVWEKPDGTIVDVTPPKFGTRVLFVPDPSLAIGRIGKAQQLHNNRTNFAQAPRLRDGSEIDEEYFGIPDDQPSLVQYCKRLGFPDTSME
jgi:hypothetical protein